MFLFLPKDLYASTEVIYAYYTPYIYLQTVCFMPTCTLICLQLDLLYLLCTKVSFLYTNDLCPPKDSTCQVQRVSSCLSKVTLLCQRAITRSSLALIQ
jgi:hypothetical protein